MCSNLYSTATAESLPSEETIGLLTEVLYELPDLGNQLLRVVGLVHLRLDIHIACLHRYLDELSDTGAASNVVSREPVDTGRHVAAARFYRLLALFDVTVKEAAEKKSEVRRLLLRIVNLLSSGTSVLDRTTVLSCLFAQKSQLLCRLLVKLLDTADLHQLISSSVPPHIRSLYSITPGSIMPISSFHDEQTLCTDITCKATSEHELITDDTSSVLGTLDKTGILSSFPSSVNDDVVRIIALSSTASHRPAWYHLYLTCFERKIHFLDLFLVMSHILCVSLCITDFVNCVALS